MKIFRSLSTYLVLLAAVACSGSLIAQSSASSSQAAAPAAHRSSSSAAGQQTAANKGDQLDINTATEAQLKALPGIGDAYAAKIVKGRPYTAKNQLTQKGIIPQATYDKVKDQIVAHRIKK